MSKGYAGSIAGPDEKPELGAYLTFHVTDLSGFKGLVLPYVYAEAFQNGEQVYGELKPVLVEDVIFPKFGYDSPWSEKGGSAQCEVRLVAYAGVNHGGTIAVVDSVNFEA